jgi:hypothetical protein
MSFRARVSFVAVCGVLLLSASGCKDKKALIVLRNGLGTDTTVTLDHKDVVVGGHQSVPVEVPPGEYEMTTNTMMLLETKTVSLKNPGDTAIYNIGGGGDLALVSLPEGNGDPIIRPITAPITTLEPTEMLAKPNVNEKLPATPIVKPGVTAYYLCTYDAATKALGCKREK